MSCHQQRLAAFQERGGRLTAQRALILEDLYHHRGHCTAEAVYERVRARLPGLNRATVYRTLEAFQAAGLVVACKGDNGVTEFELIEEGENHHHHLRCRRCGAELALDAGPIESLKADILRSYGFHADLDHLHISGLCAACAAA